MKLTRAQLLTTGTSLAVLALAAATTVAIQLRAESPATTAAPAAPPAPTVTVATVELRNHIESEELTGHVEAIESVDLRAEVGGRIDSVHFQAGQTVAVGDLLFTIDPRNYRATQAAALAAVARAEALATTARKESERAAHLVQREAISVEEADLRRTHALEADANLLAARAALDRANLDLERTAVRAPIAGRVSRALVTPGNLVSPATPLTTLVSTGQAYVYANLDEPTLLRFNRLQQAGRIQRDVSGRIPVQLQLSDESDYPRVGHIESTDNRLSTATGTLQVRMVFPNTDQTLVPGLFARVRVPLGEPTPTILIAQTAIGTDQSQKFVLALDADQKATYRAVQLGGIIEGKRIVRSGLKPGDQVIVNGLQRVRPGMSVIAQHAEPPTSAPSVAVIN